MECECGSYRTLKLLEHAMKVIEHVVKRRIRDKIKMDAMQFGFVPVKQRMECVCVCVCVIMIDQYQN